MVFYEGQSRSQLHYSCQARGLSTAGTRWELMARLKQGHFYPRSFQHSAEDVAEAVEAARQKDKRPLTILSTPKSTYTLTPPAITIDDTDMSDGPPAPSTVLNEPTTPILIGKSGSLPVNTTAQDTILRDFLERERELSLREGCLLERERRQALRQNEVDNRSRQIRVKSACLSKRAKIIGDIEQTQQSQGLEAWRLQNLQQELNTQQGKLKASERAIAKREDEINQRIGTSKQQAEKDQTLGEREYHMEKREKDLQRRKQAVAAKENEPILPKLKNSLHAIPTEQAAEASAIIQTDFYGPRLSAPILNVPQTNYFTFGAGLPSASQTSNNNTGPSEIRAWQHFRRAERDTGAMRARGSCVGGLGRSPTGASK